jgi:crossover junction endodeoxyribonuclease RuvC
LRRSAADLRILGIDPGTTVTGYGVVEAGNGHLGRLVECGVIRTNPRDPLAKRLADLYDGVRALIARHHPGAVALESVFYGKNVRTTVSLGHARGVILLAAAQAELEVAEFAPARVKKIVVGAGAATKPQVGYMVRKLLRLERAPSPTDAADGVAIALTYLLTRRP